MPNGTHKFISLLAISALAVGPTAFGQSGNRSADPTGAVAFEQCLETPPEGDQAACIGVMVNNCNAPQGTTAEIVGCIDRETAYWDERLNASYAELDALLKAEDRGSPYQLAQLLGRAQNAWQNWRDANCSFYANSFRGGSMGRIYQADCRLNMTAERVFEIEDLMADTSEAVE